MIFGIGTDIVQIDRLRGGLDRFGRRFAERILSPAELERFDQLSDQAAFLAKRFAVKEATVKALGTGFRDGMSLRDIYVDHNELGKPLLVLAGRVRDYADANQVGECLVSVSDERDYAVAFVTLMKAT